MIYFVSMDVTCGHLSIAHCVSSDLRFGLGVAKQIKEKFGQIDVIEFQDCGVGKVAVTCPNQNPHHPPRFIFHLFTKTHCFQKPSEASLEKCLWKLREKMINLGVRDVQAPRLASGLDKMRWKRVLTLIGRVFGDSEVNIHICSLPGPGDA